MATKNKSLSVRQKDINKSITYFDKSKKDINQTVKYDSFGKSDENLVNKFNDDRSCALKIIRSKENVYKIKSQRGGKFFNPLNNSSAYGLNKKDKVTGNMMFKFREVSEKSFQDYIKFLISKLDSYLVSAQRNKR